MASPHGCFSKPVKERERSLFFFFSNRELWKFKSCGDFSFPLSAPGYFLLTFPKMCNVCAPVCLFQLSDHRVLPEQRTRSCVVQSAVKHIPRLHTFLPFGLLCLHDFPLLLPVSQRPPRDREQASIHQDDRLLQYDVFLRWSTWRPVTCRAGSEFPV